MNTIELTEENFLIECARHYKIQCQGTDEFMADLKRLKYIKKLITKFIKNNILEERLLLNHIIILNNVFGPEFLCKILILKIYPYMEYIKPFLLYLHLLPDYVTGVNNTIYNTIQIPMNPYIIEKLRELENYTKKINT